MKTITTTSALAAFCLEAAKRPYVTVDTEFLRERTYYAKLCLVQLAMPREGDDSAVLVDPLAEGLSLQPLWDLMADKAVVKVFHAARQDLEIFFHDGDVIPEPLFDTQVAAMVCGFGEQVGYETLVRKIVKQGLDKTSRFTDWSRRPLNDRQLKYAIGDVTHLSEIFPRMLEKLKDTNRGMWINAEMEKLADPENYVNDPEQSWKRVKSQGRNLETLGRLKALAAWREHEAQSKDLPRGRIVRDETLADIAAHPPRDQSKLGQVRGLSNGWKNNDIGERLMEALGEAEPLPRDDLPQKNNRRPKNGKENALVADLLKLLLKIRSAELNVASRLLARAEDLERIVAGEREDVSLLEGWRYEQFGRDALDLIEGRVSFTVKDGKLKMTHQPEKESETPK